MAHRYHRLKSWPWNLQPIIDGKKHCDIRRADRDYQEGDYLHIEEWVPVQQEPSATSSRGRYTGKVRVFRVTYIDGPFPLRAGPEGDPWLQHVALSIASAPGGLPADSVEVPARAKVAA